MSHVPQTEADLSRSQTRAYSDGSGGDDSSTAPVDLSGTILDGRYRILKKIGEGGMGAVYLAEHTKIGKRCAVKLLSPSLASKPAAIERFLREAKTSSRIEHANVVEITDFGSSDDKLPFFVMEYLEGEELAETITREGALPWPRVRRILLQILAALEVAHEQGVVHRDMKPQNCFRVRRNDGDEDEDFIKVLDFGIAKVISEDPDFKTLTQTGAVVGTVHYMSPEQARAERVDARSDIYSVGVIAYKLLTGQVPYDASAMVGVLSKLLTEDVPAMSTIAPDVGVHPRVEALVCHAMAKQRADRFPSAVAFAAAIQAIPEELPDPEPEKPEPASRVWELEQGAPLELARLPGTSTTAPVQRSGPARPQVGPPAGHLAKRQAGGSGLVRMIVVGLVGVGVIAGIGFAAQKLLRTEEQPAAAAPAEVPKAELPSEQGPVLTPEAEQAALYESRVQAAIAEQGLEAVSLDQLRQPNAFHHPITRSKPRILAPSSSKTEGPLLLSVRVDNRVVEGRGMQSKTQHTTLRVQNRGEVPVAYRLDMRKAGGGDCRARALINYDAMVIDAGQTVEISVCSGRQSVEILDLRMLEITPLGAGWVRKIPPRPVGLSLDASRAHAPTGEVEACTMGSSELGEAISAGTIAWEDAIDFYSRHDCTHYQWWPEYRRAKAAVDTLPMLSP